MKQILSALTESWIFLDEIIEDLDYVMVGLHPMIWPQTFFDGYHLLVENIFDQDNRNDSLRKKLEAEYYTYLSSIKIII